ncbi:MAG TPA: PTS sugar transporter [Ruminococcaceae bacterium]|nr:PTS sugar transporter [Oscillospiraceae bacterium]
MITTKISIDTVEKVKEFSSITTKENIDGELVQGIHIVDAKSVMGFFSLDLSRPVTLNIHSDDKTILDKISKFIVG